MSQSTMSTIVAKINNVNIVVIENGEKRIAIKPICDALGIDADYQIQKIKNDEILGQLHETSRVVASDGKTREMVTIPFKWIFGWMFSINPKLIKSESRNIMMKYRVECYNALYNHFAELDEYMMYRAELVESKFDELEKVRDDFKDAKYRLERVKKEFENARSITFDLWKTSRSQTRLEFPDEKPVFHLLDEPTEV